jgi:hypothetical protein
MALLCDWSERMASLGSFLDRFRFLKYDFVKCFQLAEPLPPDSLQKLFRLTGQFPRTQINNSEYTCGPD